MWWLPVVITIQHTEDRHLSLLLLYITLYSSWIKYQSRINSQGLGSWEVLLCWHTSCLLTSHSRPHSGCFWLSAAIWNANRFLDTELKTFLPCLSYFFLPTASALLWPLFISVSPFHKQLFTQKHLTSKRARSESHLCQTKLVCDWFMISVCHTLTHYGNRA